MRKLLAMLLALLMLAQNCTVLAESTSGVKTNQTYEVISDQLEKTTYHIVSFTVEGEEVTTIFVADGSTVETLPDAPEKEGQTFAGWYDGETLFTSETAVTGDLSLEAVYKNEVIPASSTPTEISPTDSTATETPTTEAASTETPEVNSNPTEATPTEDTPTEATPTETTQVDSTQTETTPAKASKAKDVRFYFEYEGSYANVSIAGTCKKNQMPTVNRNNSLGGDLTIVDAWTVSDIKHNTQVSLEATVTAMPEEGALSAYTVAGGKPETLMGENLQIGDTISFDLAAKGPVGIAFVSVSSEPAEEEITEIEDALYANDDLYITGKVPGNGIIEAIPVTVTIDDEEVIAAYDIKIYANEKQKEKGKTWKPAGKKVQVHFYDEGFNGKLNVYHIDETKTEYIDTVTAENGWVSFEAESFSTYAVTKLIEKTVTIDGNTYKITVTYDKTAGIPEGSELAVTEVEGDEYLSQTAEALGWTEEDETFYTKFLDISIVHEGQEIEPATPVEVKVELLDVTDGGEALEVVHFTDSGVIKMDSEAEADGTVTFVTDSFSTFGFGSILRTLLSWTSNAVSYTLQGFSTLLRPTFSAIEVTVEEGLEVLNAYNVQSTLGSLLNALYVKVSTALNLGSRESVVVYSVVDGNVGDVLAEEESNINESLSLKSADGFAVVRDTGYRRKIYDLGAVMLNGMMPKAAEAEATEAGETAETMIAELEGEVLAAFDIKIAEDGNEYQPDADHPVDVSIDIGETETDPNKEIQVWHIQDDGTKEEITDFTVEDGKVSFTATSFSVYVIVETTLIKTVDASDGNTYEINVTYKNTSGIPMEGTELLVSELLPGDEGYDEYVAASAAKVGTKTENIELSRVFDIQIVDQNDHSTVYEPSGDVTVSIRLVGETLGDYANLNVLHFVEDENVEGFTVYDMNGTVDGETVQFTTHSFSVYVVAGYTLEKVITTPDGLTYKITVTFKDDALLPDEAALDVVELSGEAYEDYVGRTAVAMNAAGFDYARVFDISIVDGEGNRIQPSAPVDVTVELLDTENPEDSFSVVHFAVDGEDPDLNEQPILMETETEANIVTFSTDGFSAYAIVTGPEAIPIGWDKISSIEELIEKGAIGLYIGHPDGYYYGNTTTGDSSRMGITKTKPAKITPADTAAKYYFEQVEGTTDQFYAYCYASDGTTKQYVYNGGNNSLSFTDESDKTAFTMTRNSDGTFKLNNGSWYWNMQGGATGTRFCSYNNANDRNNKVYFWYYMTVDTDPYDLNGKSYGLMNWNETPMGRAMMAADENSDNALDAKSLIVMSTSNNSSQMFVPKESDISMWTFHWKAEDKYTISVSADGSIKYLKIESAGLSLVSSEDEASRIQVVPGTGNYTGQVCLKANNTTLTYSGAVDTGFSVDGTAGSEWLHLVEVSELTDDYFRTYSAQKVSVSDSSVGNGSRVIVYARTWNDEAKRYEFYAIDSAGTLTRVYESGDNVEWVGPALNTMLWNLVEYTDEASGLPNGFFELFNQYSEKFIAPQITGSQILSPDTIGINLPGRTDGYYYTKIVAWDDANYAYVGLKADRDQGKIVACPQEEADDFYFAIVQDIPVDDVLHTVPTVDHAQYGITMKIVNLENGGNDHNGFMSQLMGDNTYIANAPTQGLLSTNLGSNGYPMIVKNTNTSLSAMYSGADQVNHLFIQSTYSASGYFEYDSSQNFASLKGSNFEVYKEIASYDSGGNKNTLKHGQFFPFNDIKAGVFASVNGKNLYSAEAKLLPDSDPRKYERLYSIEHDGHKADCYLAMELQASFTQTPNGRDAWGHDIIYEFTGDDDFWLYVDGELVIDLGGIHSALPGSVNFATGQVNVNGSSTTLRDLFIQNYISRGHTEAEANDYVNSRFKQINGGQWVFKDNTTHTMRIFYMERGAGASNLHMRFNLASVKPGTVELKKTLSLQDPNDELSDSVYTEYMYQIYYKEGAKNSVHLGNQGTWRSDDENVATVNGSGTVSAVAPGTASVTNGTDTFTIQVRKINGVDYVMVYDRDGHILSDYLDQDEYLFDDRNLVKYKDTTTRVSYRASYTIPNTGKTYEHVFLLKPGQTAVITLPEEAAAYRIVECAVNENVYNAVRANDMPLSGTGITYEDPENPETDLPVANRKDYSTDYTTSDNVPRVTFDNEIKKLRSLEIKKILHDVDSTVLSATQDNTEFSFRLYLATEYDLDVTEHLTNMQSYHVKDPDGYYCRWNAATQAFESLGNSDFKSLSSSQKSAATFNTSTYGSISKIRAGYTVEIRGLLPGTQYRVEERSWEIPDGYSFSEYEKDTAADEVDRDGVPGVVGTIIADESSRVKIHNIKGFGLRVNKTWTDASFMQSRDPVFFGVFTDDGEGHLEIVPNSVKAMVYGGNQTLYWYYNSLPVSGVAFDHYVIREVTLTNPTLPDPLTTGAVVSSYASLIILNHNDPLTLTGQQKDDTEDGNYTYTVLYEDVKTSQYSNVHTFPVANDRPSIKLMKTEWDGTPLAGASFTLKDSNGAEIGTFTSDATGLITLVFLGSSKTYTLAETAAPQGYRAMQGTMNITISNQNITVAGVDDTDEYVLNMQTTPMTLTIKNRPYTFQAVKYGEDDNGQQAPLEGVYFELHKQTTVDGVTMYEVAPMSGYDSLRTNEDGVIPKLDNTLPAGNYQLREKTPPSGYQPLSGYIHFTVSDTGVITLVQHQEASLASSVDNDTGKIAYTMTVQNRRRADLTVTKTVTGDMGDTTKAFTFTVTGLPSGESYVYKKYMTTDGTNWREVTSGGGTMSSSDNTFTLTHNQKVVIEGLPLNMLLSVTETHENYTISLPSSAPTNMSDYSVSHDTGGSTVNGASFKLNGNADLAFSNNLPAVAPTGLSFAYAPFLLMGAAGIMLGLIGRRKHRQEE